MKDRYPSGLMLSAAATCAALSLTGCAPTAHYESQPTETSASPSPSVHVTTAAPISEAPRTATTYSRTVSSAKGSLKIAVGCPKVKESVIAETNGSDGAYGVDISCVSESGRRESPVGLDTELNKVYAGKYAGEVVLSFVHSAHGDYEMGMPALPTPDNYAEVSVLSVDNLTASVIGVK